MPDRRAAATSFRGFAKRLQSLPANCKVAKHARRPQALCRRQAARDPRPPRPDPGRLCRQARRLAAPTSTRWRTTTARSRPASCWRWRRNSASTSPSSPPASSERMVADMREALADPVFGTPPPLGDLQLVASNAPNLARAFLTLHRAYRADPGAARAAQRGARPRGGRAQRRCRGRRCATSSTTATTTSTRSTAPPSISPPGSPRATGAPPSPAGSTPATASRSPPAPGAPLRRFEPRRAPADPRRRRRRPPTQAFQILHQVALLEHDDLLEATLDLARFRTDAARAICKTGLANYFAGAALLPYAPLPRARPGAAPRPRGAGPRLRRLDRAGGPAPLDAAARRAPRASPSSSSASTRPAPSPSATPRRACSSPASAAPARSGTSTGPSRRRAASCASWPRPRTACATSASPATSPSPAAASAPRSAATPSASAARSPMPAAWSMPTTWTSANDAAYEPIGISCRICPRRDCHQRAVPPLEAPVIVDPDERGPAALPASAEPPPIANPTPPRCRTPALPQHVRRTGSPCPTIHRRRRAP